MIDNLLLLRDLTDSERMMFQGAYNNVRRNPTTGVLLALFLRGIGAHHFYLGSMASAFCIWRSAGH